MPSAHAKYSPSDSSAWMNCPGKLNACEGLPNPTTVYAEWGTVAHELAEMCLRNGDNAYAYEGRMLGDFPVDAEMMAAVQPYLDQVRSEGELVGIEVALDFSHKIPDLFGTADAVRIKNNTLIIDDLKTGQGVRVDANGNTQMLIYALMAYTQLNYLYDIDTISMRIHQTRLNHYDIWEIGLADLLAFEQTLFKAVEATKAPNPPRIPGEKQCRWCLANKKCAELAQHSMQLVRMQFDDLTTLASPATLPPPVQSLTDAQVAYLLPKFDLVKAWIKAVEDRAYDTLTKGGVLQGYKLVTGRSLRKWTDEKAAAKLLEQAGFHPYEQKLISVAQAEKLMGKKHFGDFSPFYEKPEGKPVLAPEDDKRPSLDLGFENLTTH